MYRFWPETYAGMKEGLCSAWGVKKDIEILQELTGGRSEASVYVVDLESRNHRGMAILKLQPTQETREGQSHEAERYRPGCSKLSQVRGGTSAAAHRHLRA